MPIVYGKGGCFHTLPVVEQPTEQRTIVPPPSNNLSGSYVYVDRDGNEYSNARALLYAMNPGMSKDEFERLRKQMSNALLAGRDFNGVKRYKRNGRGKMHGDVNRPRAKAVECVEENMTFASIRDAARFLSRIYPNKREATMEVAITNCCHKRTKSAYGYTWRFADA